VTFKGKEIKMPEGSVHIDKDGTTRTQMRIKWWEDPSNLTYKEISVVPLKRLPQIPVSINDLNNPDYYKTDDKMVFFGHYWLNGQPSLFRNNICCLDYSVAKAGKLVAYRLDEETILDERKLVFV
jgi:hypothetical protein